MLQDLLDWIDGEDHSVPILQSNGSNDFSVTEQGQTGARQPEIETFCWLDEFTVPNDLST